MCRNLKTISTYLSSCVDAIDSFRQYVDMRSENRHVPPDPEVPHNELPAPPDRGVLETTASLKASIEARDAILRLRTAAAQIPNPSILINAIPLLEARDSSRVENIVTTSDELFQHQHAPDAAHDPATKEALRYRTALMDGHRTLAERPISTRLAIDVMRTLLHSDASVRKVPGTSLRNAVTGQVVYTPPEGEAVILAKLGEWERLVHDDRLDALVRMATAHYHFEAIHPFNDGNGRTGRILNTLMLVEAGLLDEPLLYLSRFILAHRDEYYRLLRGVTFEHAWAPWIEFMIRGVRETADWAAELIHRIDDLMNSTDAHLQATTPRIHSAELMRVLFTYPYARIGNVVDAGIAKRQTASTYLHALAELGVLEARPVGRETLFVHHRLLGVLAGEDVDPVS